MTEKSPTPWLKVFSRAAAVSVLSSVASLFVSLPPVTFLAFLFFIGAVAGAWARRQGWFSGTIVGFPTALTQITRWTGSEAGSPDYWRLAAPAAAVAAGMAILGGMTGAWLQDMKLQREA